MYPFIDDICEAVRDEEPQETVELVTLGDDNITYDAGLQDLPAELLIYLLNFDLKVCPLMLVNKRFLNTFAPTIYDEIHGMLPLIQEDQFPKLKSLMVQGDERLDVVHPKLLQKGKNMVQRIFNQTGYRILHSSPVLESYGLTSKQLKEVEKVTFLQDHHKLQKLCTNVINNENSIFRRFIHTFSVDIMFLDELHTSRVGYMRSLINEYAGRNYITAETKRYQVYNNYDLSFFADFADCYDNYLDKNLSQEDKTFWMAPGNVISKKIPFSKVPAMSKIYEIFLTGDRKKMMKTSKKSDVLRCFDRFGEFRPREGRVKHLPFFLSLIPPDYFYNTRYTNHKKVCQTECSKVEFQVLEENDFASKEEILGLMEALLKATCRSAIKQRSMLVTSCKKDNSTKVTKEHEINVAQKQKVLLINRTSK